MSKAGKSILDRASILLRHPVTGRKRPLSGLRQANALLAKLEQRMNRLRPLSHPIYAVIEPTNICNLECPFCPTGLRIPGRKKGMMSMETLDRFLKQVGKYLFDAEMYNWGESLLHPDIYRIIERVKQEGIHTGISTHFSLKDRYDPERLVKSGLDYLIIAIDAACPETHVKYRKGGDFELVLHNVRTIVETRRRLRSDSPYIMLKYVVFRHNEGEQGRFIELARELGADNTQFVPGYIPEEAQKDFEAEQPPWKIETFEPGSAPGRNCHWLWTGVALNWDGSIAPCCHGISYYDKYDFGHLDDGPFHQIWTNDLFQQARAAFIGKRPEREAADLCYLCKYRA